MKRMLAYYGVGNLGRKRREEDGGMARLPTRLSKERASPYSATSRADTQVEISDVLIAMHHIPGQSLAWQEHLKIGEFCTAIDCN